DDLKTWLAGEATTHQRAAPSDHSSASIVSQPPARIVPKGLRAFDIEDADFFLTLVPGPRDRDGLPESVRAWKPRIEAPDPARACTVGLRCGPSGSGKSSIVKAGILPRLGAHVRAIYVEASAGGTETQLVAALRRECPELPAGCPLGAAMAELRES